MLEDQIKALTINKLISSKAITDNSVLLNEFNIDRHSRRVDLAVANQNSLIAFEIKSEFDTLQRLEGQTETYQKYFDKVIVVAASKHIKNILNVVPSCIGVWEVRNDTIVVRRKGRKKAISNPVSYLNLMKVQDLNKLASHLEISLTEKNRTSLERALIRAPLKQLRKHAFMSIQTRFQKSTNKFLIAVKNRKVINDDISLLSRFKKMREISELRSSKHKSSWKEFNSKPIDELYNISVKL